MRNGYPLLPQDPRYQKVTVANRRILLSAKEGQPKTLNAFSQALQTRKKKRCFRNPRVKHMPFTVVELAALRPATQIPPHWNVFDSLFVQDAPEFVCAVLRRELRVRVGSRIDHALDSVISQQVQKTLDRVV